MKKKLLAILMSASMVLSFMPSIAFAAAATYAPAGTKIADAWKWTPGEKTATLVKIANTADDKDTREVSYPATVEYSTYTCGETVKNVTVTFNLKDTVTDLSAATKAYTDQTVTFPAHQYEEKAGMAESCGEEGYTSYKKCKNCGDEVGKETISGTLAAKDSHTVTVDAKDSHWEKTDATHVTLKKGATLKCEDCGRVFTSVADSTNGEIKNQVIKAATCSTKGLKGRSAKVTVAATNLVDKNMKSPAKAVEVNYVLDSEELPTTPHTYDSNNVKFVWNTKTPSCVAKIGGCKVCGTGATEIACTVTADPSSATNTNCSVKRDVTYTATCKDSAGKVYTPTTASEATKVYSVAAGQHSFVLKPAVAATCDKAGNKEYYECSACKKLGDLDKSTGKIVANTKTAADYTVNARHEMTGTYTWPSDKELQSAIDTSTIVTNYKNGNATFSTDNETLTGKNVTVSDLKCKNCDLKYKATKTEMLPIKIDAKAFYEKNAGKACTDDIVVPLVVEDKAETNINKDDLLNATVADSHKATKVVVIGTSKTASSKAVGHHAKDVTEFKWDTSDSKNIKCNVVLHKCDHKVVVFDASTNSYKYDTKNVCDHVITVQPATVEGKITTEPTCTKNGEGEFTASYKYPVTNKVITDKKVIALAKIDHKATVIEAVAPTVFTEGKTAGVKCAICGEILEAPKTVEKAKYAAPTVKAGKKLATVTVKSTKGAVKYQISYKKAGGKYVTKTVKAGKKVTIKKLAKGKKYTFKAVAINADGVKATSAVKTVKIK